MVSDVDETSVALVARLRVGRGFSSAESAVSDFSRRDLVSYEPVLVSDPESFYVSQVGNI